MRLVFTGRESDLSGSFFRRLRHRLSLRHALPPTLALLLRYLSHVVFFSVVVFVLFFSSSSVLRLLLLLVFDGGLLVVSRASGFSLSTTLA